MKAPYLVLARKYRPKALGDLVGQASVAESLRNALKEGRVAHAYLFAGPRGVGKTSTARILARALNCAAGSGPTTEPCGRCDPCREIEAGGDADVLEMDAASHRGIDDARALRDAVSFRPLRDRHRVYVVDECHMLTNEAWNALLKTLEEPPGHVRFVFATTALEKVPETIRSRCQVFEFRRIGEAEIAARLRRICEQEKFEVGEDLLASIAGASRGGMRDALSLLDQLVSFAGPRPAPEHLVELLGASERGGLLALFEEIAAGDRAKVLRGLDDLFRRGADEETLLDQAVGHLHRLLLVRLCGKEAPGVGESETPERLEALSRQAARFSPERLEEMAQALLAARWRLRDAPALRRAVAEVGFLRLCRGEEYLPVGAILERLEALERSLASGRATAAPGPAATGPPAPRPAEPKALAPSPPRPGATDPWSRVVEAVRRRSPLAAESFARCRPASLEGPVLRLPVAKLREGERRLVEDARNLAAAEAEARSALGPGTRLELETAPAEEGRRPAPRAAPPVRGASADHAAAEVARQFDGDVLEEGR
ncbi:MAG: DNA polymerase III subunit gamma/tau [Planctomycetes bacterium]|nr:DNA polymerase III subunit gamma/tau [Planctomycetota bacterium]